MNKTKKKVHMWWRSVTFTSALFGTMIFIVPNVVWLIVWLVALIFGINIPYAPFGWTALALLLLTWITFAYGYYFGRFKSKVTQVEYASKDVPEAFDGYKIVHISDLHVDSFDEKPEALKRMMNKVNEQNADIILFTGDITTAEMDDISIHEDSLKSLTAHEGVVSVMGNHDFFIYCPEFTTDTQRCAEADRLTVYEREHLGWRVLRNESFLLHHGEERIAIAGVDNINGNQGFSTIRKGDLKAATKGLDGIFTVLLTHDPSHWEAEVLPKSHVQITLSGHTHAAQMCLFGWSLANLMFKECDGRYDHDGRMLYVNAGIGCTAPFRIDCPAEITVITLKSVQDER